MSSTFTYQDIHNSHYQLLQQLMNGDMKSPEYWKMEKIQINNFKNQFPCEYAKELADCLDNELKRISMQSFIQKDMLTLRLKFLNGDENGEYESDAYWEAVADNVNCFYNKYKTEYVKAIALQFIDELEMKMKEKRKQN